MKTRNRAALLVFFPTPLFVLGSPAQTPTQIPEKPKASKAEPSKDNDTVVMSGVATTARIADPNEQVVFNGRVMRMADFVAAVSSSTEAVPRPHNPEKRNREKDQPIPQSKPLN